MTLCKLKLFRKVLYNQWKSWRIAKLQLIVRASSVIIGAQLNLHPPRYC